MSEEIFESDSLYVRRFTGPAGDPDRQRWQFTLHGESYLYAVLNRDEILRLREALAEIPSFEPPRISGEGTAANGPMPLEQKDAG